MDIVDWDGWFHEKNGYGGLKKMSMSVHGEWKGNEMRWL